MFATHRSFGLSNGIKGSTIAVYSDARMIRVIYHQTVVVSANKVRGKWFVTLNDGGWETISTRFVINTALRQIPGFESYQLYRHKGKTVISSDGWNSKGEPFTSGMRLTAIKPVPRLRLVS